jgi:hypothetical protein
MALNEHDAGKLGAEAAALEGEYIPKGAPGAQAEEAPPTPSTGELLTMLLRPLFNVVAPAWEVSDDECELLGQSYGAVADKYFPNLELGVELSAVVTTVMVFGTRWGKPRKIETEKPEETPAPSSG